MDGAEMTMERAVDHAMTRASWFYTLAGEGPIRRSHATITLQMVRALCMEVVFLGLNENQH
jgi:hypothetical protein